MKDTPTGHARWQEVGGEARKEGGVDGSGRAQVPAGVGRTEGGTEPRRPFTHSGAASRGPRALTQPPQGGRPPARVIV